ncbi:MAG: RidA family protein [Victivallales bacterium]|jgi:2-iminobutanoate/2-iminopropanoate deaminase|nr:RidA family protein [Victivallales bacterium]MBT7161871.1 RidA family protein [Victivallales bacterium]MBT7301030.1 RidA family protein [Victivallales bacterium]
MNTVNTHEAPAAVGPYSQAIEANGLLFCSGQIALDPETGTMVGDDVATQTGQVLKNLFAVLAADGLGPQNVAKTTVFLQDMGQFTAMNQVYANAFGEHRPARAAVEVAALPKGALVEIECIAARE